MCTFIHENWNGSDEIAAEYIHIWRPHWKKTLANLNLSIPVDRLPNVEHLCHTQLNNKLSQSTENELEENFLWYNK